MLDLPRSKSRFALIAFATSLIFVTSVADARIGRGGSFGSRGAKTWSAPPATQTAPRTAQPMQRSTTDPATTSRQAAPGTSTTAPSTGMFGRGLAGGLLGGLLGAGLIGMLLGNGFLGGLGGFASMLGLLLQLALVFFIARWAFRWWQRRNQPAYAGAGGASYRDAAADPGKAPLRRFDIGGAAGASAGAASPAGEAPLEIGQEDLEAFERLLGEIQTAYSNEDREALRRRTTPEMFVYFGEELDDNETRGVVNRVSDVRLLQGDPAEAWREGEAEYATVAMRFGLRDVVEDRATGAVVETGPSEATEVWTFRRKPGADWKLSAIQQA
ncbi:TIM44-like domain-containing protein [Faunimonas sp. B44]|uniref:TIM44-like domain-containing protein n=1 Tax=Faunimonas sp. B44 TaxID=3461493 RepID=UPI004044B3C0